MFNRYKKQVNHTNEIERMFNADNYELMTVSKENRLFCIVKETFESDDKYIA
tara:strand:+ start:258 stop:413 length:156 start_codon:yes stop_codon:yes gene_type:complete